MRKKILISIVAIYLITLHIVIFFSYFEKVVFKDNEAFETLTISFDNEYGLFASSNAVHLAHIYDDDLIGVGTYRSLEILSDSIAVITDVFKNYKSTFLFSSDNNYFWGHPYKSEYKSSLYLVRGDCLISFFDANDQKTDSLTKASLRGFFDGLNCDFKENDFPSGVYRIEKIHRGIRLYNH